LARADCTTQTGSAHPLITHTTVPEPDSTLLLDEATGSFCVQGMNSTTPASYRSSPTMIPITLKHQLLALARHLSPTRRGGFLRSVVQRIDELALTYPRTVVYAAAGCCVGQVIDAITGFPAGLPGLVAGGLFGLHRDLNADTAEEQVRRIIQEEFQNHFDI